MPVYRFLDVGEATVAEIGGKGFSLRGLVRAGFPVPDGFVLSVSYFEPWLERLRQLPEWETVVAASGNADLREACEVLKAHVADLTFTEPQERGLVGHLQSFPPGTLFAVRSSSPEEDLEGAAFAGVYETVLGVPASGIEGAVRRVFASCLDTRVAIYKRERGIESRSLRIAVVVQRQVASEVAGVGFSLNPITNAYDEACFSANWGLGETVVSGTASPDFFVVDKVKRQVIARQIGKKETSLWLTEEGGTVERPNQRLGEPTLTNGQLLALTDQIIRIEALYGRPVDIEWAWAGGRLYLLQARPVTAYLPVPADLVSEPGAPKRLYWDVTISVQGVLRPTTPLATSFLAGLLSEISKCLFGRDITARIETTIPFAAHGRLYVNLSNVLTLMSRDRLARLIFNIDPVAAASLSTADESEYRAAANVLGRLRWSILRRGLARTARIIGALVRPEQARRDAQHAVERFVRCLRKKGASQAPTWELARHAQERVAVLLFNRVLPRFAASRIALALIRRLFRGASPTEGHLLDRLDQSLPGNLTVEMGLALAGLARHLPPDTTSTDVLERRLRESQLPTSFLAAWNDFLARFGHRAAGEIDIAVPRYREQPRVLLEQVVRLAQVGKRDASPLAIYENSQRQRQEAYEALLVEARSIGRLRARLFRALYRVVETLGAYRETGKFYIVVAIDALRSRVLSDAEKLVASGRLGRPLQVFDLAFEDLERAASDRSLDLSAVAAQRRQTVDRLRGVPELPRLFDSRGRILRSVPAPGCEGELRGQPISSGVARGPVKVLHTPDEKPFLPGDILVARATDPGWTPLFVNAAGVVLEIGGAMQHGALVAREYGKPCVASVTGATERLRDGMRVEVDGAAGIVRICTDAT